MASRASSKQREIPNGDQFEYAAERLMLRYYRAIRRRMREKEITQTELAERLGVSQAYVSKVLKYNQNLTIRSLAELAEVMDAEWEPRLVPKEMGIHYRDFDEHADEFRMKIPNMAVVTIPPYTGSGDFNQAYDSSDTKGYTGELSDDYEEPLAA